MCIRNHNIRWEKGVIEKGGVIFFLFGILMCLIALLFMGMRGVRIGRIKNSAKELPWENGRVIAFYDAEIA